MLTSYILQGLLADCLLTETLSQWTLNKLLSLVESIKSEFNLLLAGGDSASPTQAGGGATGAETTAPPTTAGLMSIPAEEVSHITTALDQLQITCQTFTVSEVPKTRITHARTVLTPQRISDRA